MIRTLFFNPSFLLAFSCCKSARVNGKNLKEKLSVVMTVMLFLMTFFMNPTELLAQKVADSNLMVSGVMVQTSDRNSDVDLSPSLTTIQNFQLDSPNCSKTYVNTRCWGSPALSHFVLGLPNCITASDIAGVFINGQPYNNWTVGDDPTCGVYGLKWDNLNLGSNTCAEFKVVLVNSYEPQLTLGYDKSGPNCTNSPAYGPSCVPCNPCPDDNCSITGLSTVCPGSTTNAYSGPNGDYQYSWSISGVGSSIEGPTNQQTVNVNAAVLCNSSFTLTLTITSGQCTYTCTKTVNMNDTEAPVVVSGPGDIIVECSSQIPPPGDVEATDNCGTVFVQFLGDFIYPGDCESTYLVQRTWKISDRCTNHVYHKQLITVVDTTAPVISSVGPNFSVECPTSYEFSTPTALDACDGEVELSFTDSSSIDLCGLGSITRTWTATDCAGNTSSASQTITILDTTPPVISGVGADYNVECPDDLVFSLPNVSDDCDKQISLSFSDSYDLNECGLGTVTRTWTATDCAGNSSSASQTITINDTVAPSINNVGDDYSVECPEEAVFSMPSATDACDDKVTFSFVDISNLDLCGLGTVTRTWTATDCAGNSSSASQTITINDTVAPTINNIGDDYSVECPEEAVFSMPSATDACDEQVSLTYEDSSDLDECGLGTVTRTWTATDCAGNSSSASQTITINDTVAPSINNVGDDYTVECPEEAVFSMPSATDACDEQVSLTYEDSSDLDECGLGTVTRTWTATDCAGNSSSASQTITINDTVAPAINNVGDDYTVECPSEAVFSMPSATDACDEEVSLTYEDSSDLDACGLGTVTRTWTATDCAGNSSSASQTITINDTVAPMINNVGDDYSVECDEDAIFSMPSATDACDEEVSLTYEDSSDLDECGLGTVTRTWTATDCAGNSSSASQTITINDTTAPVFNGVGQDYTVECVDDVQFSSPTATDNCSEEVSLTYVDESSLDACGGTVTRTWTATDCTGNVSTATQTVTVIDTIAPVFTGQLPVDVTVECDDIPAPAIVTAEDNCDDDLTIVFLENIVSGDCPSNYTIIRIWQARDNCLNASFHKQTITVVDNNDPIISGVGDDYTVECPSEAVFSMPSATDACDEEVSLTYEDSSDLDECGLGTVTRTWTATDCAGNFSSASQTITIEDTTAPEISGVGENYSVECPEEAVFSMPSASDACSELVDVSYKDVSDLDACGLGTITRTWSATDCAGNTSSASQTITINDTVAPAINNVGDDYTVECPEEAVFSMPSATDACDEQVSLTYEDSSDLDECGLGTVTRTWTATDCAGNSSSASQTITINDTTAPVISGVGADIVYECGSDDPNCQRTFVNNVCWGTPALSHYTLQLGSCITASDIEAVYIDNVLTTNWVVGLDPTCGVYGLKWDDLQTSGDGCAEFKVVFKTGYQLQVGNGFLKAGTNCNGTVASAPSCETCVASLPEFDTPSVLDLCDANASISFVDSSSIDECGLGSITRTWTATDCAGNTSSASQTITVIDTIAPAISGVGEDYSVECPEELVFSTPSATDACDEEVSLTYEDSSDLDACGLGTVTRTWTATDCAGNSSSASQTITINDTVAPSINNVGDDYSVECPSEAIFSTPSANDACDEQVSLTYEDSSDLDACGLGTVTRTWTATDCAGNSSSASQTITINDTVAPTINNVGDDYSVECPSEAIFSTPSATDACDEQVSLTYQDSSDLDECGLGTVTRTWTATDCAGNSSSASQTITINDTVAPTINNIGDDYSVECPEEAVFSMPSATDACDEEVSLTYEDSSDLDACGLGTVTRTWTATDCAGNSSSASQTITINDTVAPSINNVGDDYSVECPEEAVFSMPSATDACDEEVSLTYEDSSDLDACGLGTVTRTWTATDCAGNSSSASQTITINDTVAPMINNVGDDYSVECDEDAIFSMPSATDACDEEVSLTYEDSSDLDACGLGTVTRTWTATDCAGNSSSASQTITINDTTAPVFNGVGQDYTVECVDDVQFSSPTATDNCSEEVSLTYVDESSLDACGGTVTRTWTATDCAGNVSTATQTVTVIDTIAPIFTSPLPQNRTVECDDVPAPAIVTAEDNCTEASVMLFETIMPSDCQGQYEIVRLWKAMDECGNFIFHKQIITVVDNNDPIISGVGDDYTVECPSEAVFSMPSVTDACDEEVSLSYEDSSDLDECGLGTVTRTWTATDCAGNSSSASQTITINDTVAPTINNVGDDYTVECPSEAVFSMPSATDACDEEVSLTYEDSSDLDECGLGTVTRTWTATDCAGNFSSASQTITIEDTTAPEISGVGENYSVECPSEAVFSMPSATDACDEQVSLTYEDSSDLDECGLGTVTRTWTATDCAGNSISASQTITINDTVAPAINNVGDDYSVECPEEAVFSMPSATDACDEQVSLTYEDSSDLDECGLGTVTRTWTATDCAGNSSSASQTITINDTTAPVISGVGADIVYECGSDDPNCQRTFVNNVCWGTPALSHYTLQLGSCITASDIEAVYIDNVLTTNWVVGLDPTCGVYGLKWDDLQTSGDGCAEFKVVFKTGYQLQVGNGFLKAGTNCNGTVASAPSCETCVASLPEFDTPSVLDLCDANASISFVDSSSIDECGLGSITRTWTATDCAGNTSSASQTITVIDTIAPAISGVGEDYSVECPEELVFSTPSATDACDEEVSLTYEDSSDLDACGLGTVTRTWTATDCAGNFSSASQTITINDTVAPSINNVGDDYSVECPEEAVFSMPSATDACDEQVSLTYEDSSDLDECGLGTVTRTWTATDCAGNSSSASQTITINDTVAPAINNVGDDYTVECPSEAVFSMPSATDACDEQVSLTYEDSSDLDECGLGTVTRTWTATDCAGNSSSASQTITINDTVAPTINNIGDDYSVECPEEAVFSMPSATDACDEEVSLTYEDSSDLDACGLGTVTRTWTATDCAGNSSSASQTITINDTVAPSINNVGDDYSVECPEEAVFSMPSATDACDEEVSLTYEDSSDLDACGLGTVTRTWTATDCAGNSSSASQTITINDTVAPMINNVGDDYSVECDEDAIFSMPSATDASATDACDEEVSLTYEDSSDLDACGLGTVTRTWTATDCAGNSSSASQTITINDTTAPVFNGVGQDYTVECVDDVQFSSPTATDNCSEEVSLTYVDESSLDACGGTVTRTWTATDCAGNVSTATQTVTVIDTIAPIFTSPLPQNRTVECDNIPAPEVLTATDNCGNVDVVFFESTVPTDCPSEYMIIRIWKALDGCLNQRQHKQIIHVQDTTAPVVVVPSSILEVECDGNGNQAELEAWVDSNGGAFASDNCSDVTWSNDFDGFDQACGSITVTFTATDCAGNSTQSVGVFTILPATIVLESPGHLEADCDLDIQDQFDTWLAGFAYSGGCGEITETDLSGFVLPLPGQSLTVTYVVSDACSTVTVSATFSTPVCATEGCTIGYWKNHTNRWCATYSTSTLYGSVFVNAPSQLANLTLLQVINLGGGGINNLGRQSVAALLNACHNEVDYFYGSTATIINLVNQAFLTGGNAPGLLATQLDGYNNAGCPLGGTPATISANPPRVNKSGVRAYPVPFGDKLTINYRYEYNSSVTVEFFDTKGALVHTYTDTDGYFNKEIVFNNVKSFLRQSGQVYLVKVTTDKESEILKVVSEQ
jgi:large repetitive protein